MQLVRPHAGKRTASQRDSFIQVRQILAVALLSLSLLGLTAAPVPSNKPSAYPAWWFSRGVIAPTNPTNASPSWPADYPTSDDYAAINQGQLKNFAAQAYDELQSKVSTNVLATSTWTNLSTFVSGLSTTGSNTDDYATVNLGQLKTVAQPFYNVLTQIGYTSGVPWTGVGADDYSAANIGQVKNLFAFDVSPPLLSLPGGNYTSPQSVTISAPSGDVLYYTTDGSNPTSSNTLYTGAISITGTETIKIQAYRNGNPFGDVVSATYTFPGTGGGFAITSPCNESIAPGAPFSYTITASGSPTSFSAAGLPDGLSINSSTGVISGSVATSGIYGILIGAANTTSSVQMVLTLTVTAQFTSATSIVVPVGQAFGYAAISNPAATALSESGTLPPGLSYSSDTWLVTGTPTTTGSYPISFSLTTPAGTVNATVTITVIPAGQMAIASSATASGAVGQSFFYQILGSTFPTSFTATNLPPGLTLNAGTGVISGTPLVAGTFSPVITIGNSSGTASETMTLTVTGGAALPYITSSPVIYVQEGATFNYTITSVNSPTSFGVSPLPAGLSLDSTTGILSGSIASVGTPVFQLTASNAAGSATQNLTIVVEATTPHVTSTITLQAGVAPSTSYKTTSGTVKSGTAYANYQLIPFGGLNVGAESASLSDRALLGFDLSVLPPDVSITSASLVLYRDANTANGTNSYSVELDRAQPFYPETAAWTVDGAPVAGSSALSSASLSDSASGGAVTFPDSSAFESAVTSAAKSGSLLNLLLRSTAAEGSTDTPSPFFTFETEGSLTTSERPKLLLSYSTAAPPVLSHAPVVYAAAGQPYTDNLATLTATAYGSTGLGACGLAISGAGMVSGTPPTSGSYPIQISATNANGTGTINYTLIVGPGPSITSPTSENASYGSTFSYPIIASNSPTSYSSTTLPSGLTLDPHTGVISGTFTSGTPISSFTVYATNLYGTASQVITLNWVTAVDPHGDVSGNVGCFFADEITAQPAPDSFTATGLPDGLTCDDFGNIYGDPATPGVYTVTATATLGGQTSAPLTYKITILPPPVPAIAAQTLFAVAGQPFYLPISYNYPTNMGSNTFPPSGGYSFTFSNLPGGLSYDGSEITGTPADAGTVDGSMSETINFDTPVTATAPITWIIYPNGPGIQLSDPGPAIVGQPFYYQTSPVIGSATFTSTTLPSNGLSISSSGTITGTPLVATPDGAPMLINITANDGSGNITTTTLNLPVQAAAIPETTGVPFTYALASAGSGIQYTLYDSPTWVTMDSSGNIGGTPPSAGEYSIVVDSQGPFGNEFQTLYFQVSPNPSDTVVELQEGVNPTSSYAVPSAVLNSVTLDQPGTLANVNSIGMVSAGENQRLLLSFDLSSIPAGATITSASLVVSPVSASSSGSPIDIQVYEAASAFDPATADWSTNSAGLAALLSDWSTDPAHLPATASFSTTDAFISAVQTDLAAGQVNLILESPQAEAGSVADYVGLTTHGTPGSQNPELLITYTLANGPPIITSSDSIDGTVSSPVAHSITANPKATTFAISGAPSWLSVNSTSGLISGTPPSIGTFSFFATATNTNGTASQAIAMDIDGATPISSLSVVSGDNQTALPGTFAVLPLKVNANEAGLVTFTCAPGEGFVSATANVNAATSSLVVPTDGSNNALAYLLLPQSVKPVTISVKAGIASTVTFSATAAATLPGGAGDSQPEVPVLSLIQGAAQQGASETLLGEPFIVEATHHSGVPWSSLPVSVSDTLGGGVISTSSGGSFTAGPVSTSTDANGQVAVYLKPGTGPTNTITYQATPETGSPVTISMTAVTTSGSPVTVTPGGVANSIPLDPSLDLPPPPSSPSDDPYPPDGSVETLYSYSGGDYFDPNDPNTWPWNPDADDYDPNYILHNAPDPALFPFTQSIELEFKGNDPDFQFLIWTGHSDGTPTEQLVSLPVKGTAFSGLDGTPDDPVIAIGGPGSFAVGNSNQEKMSGTLTLSTQGGTIPISWPRENSSLTATVTADSAGFSFSSTLGVGENLNVTPDGSNSLQPGDTVAFTIKFDGGKAGRDEVIYKLVGPSPDMSMPIDEAAGPKYRKIALNGMPLSDDKPQQAPESDQEPEETYIDALTLGLRHSTTDAYLPIAGSDLTLSVRRDYHCEVWNDANGLRPHERWDEPFGVGWTTNLAANIRSEVSLGDPTNPPTPTNPIPPPKTYVTDESGGVHTFFQVGGSFFPMPTAKNEQTPNLDSLTLSSGLYTYKRKYGNTLTFQSVGGVQIDSNRITGGGGKVNESYARLVQAQDRVGNIVLYHYSGATNLVPDTVSVKYHPEMTLSINQDSLGHIRKIWDANHNETDYDYTPVVIPGAVGASEWVLSSVTTTDGNTPAVTAYNYSFSVQSDTTPQKPGNYVSKYFYGDLASITDPRGNEYQFSYALDRSKENFMRNPDVYTGYYIQCGVPTDLVKVILPGGSSTTLQNQSGTWIGNIPHTTGLEAEGQRQVQVTDATGFVRLYRFENPAIFPVPALQASATTQTNIVTYLTLAIDNGSHSDGSYIGTETFNFDPNASMAVVSATDLSGNTTTYRHTDTWSDPVYQSFFFDPALYPHGANFNNLYGDPNEEIDQLGFTKYFTYHAGDRIMQSMTDQEGRQTAYDIDNLGRRTKESIYPHGSTTPIQVTDFEYGCDKYPGFMTRKTIERAATDSSGVSNLATKYVPDDNGRVAQEIVDPDGQALTTSYTYDANGNKLTATDPRGNTTWFSYDKRNRLVTVTNPDGSQKQDQYDLASNKTAEWDEKGIATLYQYDLLNRVQQQARDMNGNGSIDTSDIVNAYTYNAVNSKLTTTDPRGGVTHNVYDSLQRLTSVTDPLGNVSSFSYGTNSGGSIFDSSGFKPTQTIDPRGYQTNVVYDALYRATSKSVQYDAAGDFSTTGTTYDKVNNPVTVTDPLVRTTTTAYDALNRPVSVTYADGSSTSTQYTGTGLKSQVTDENGKTTTYTYDSAGRLTFTTQPQVTDAKTGSLAQPVTQTYYDAAGNVAATINPLGNEWDYSYDARDRKIQELAPSADGTTARQVTQWNYDPVGHVTAVIDPEGNETDTAYDPAERVTDVTQPAVPVAGGGTSRPNVHTTYDASNNVLTVTDPNGHVTTNTYDALNRLLTTTDAASITVQNSYDQVGNKLSVTDGLNHTTAFAYDGLNRNTKVTDPLGNVTTLNYNALNKTSRVDALSQTTSYTYDLRERLAGVSYSPTSAVNFARTYAYDSVGNLLSVTEAALTAANVTYAYDALNRVHTETSNGIAHEYDYDLAGNRLTTKYDTAHSGTELTLASTYDALNRLSTVSENSRTSTYSYDLNGNIVGKVSPNGDTETDAFDAINRMTSQGAVNGSNTLYSFAYGYDLAGNLTLETETYPSGLNNRTVTNAYDPINRLTTETVTGSAPNVTTSYTYDAANNRSSMGVTGGSSPGSTTYSYNSLNQLTSFSNGAGTTSYTYDANGNRSTRTQGGATDTYSYDDDNRLVGLTKNTTGGAGTYSYQYDYRTRRITRTESGVTTALVFSGGTSVREYTGTASGTPVVQYLRGSDYGGGVGGILYSLRSGTPSYTHENRRGDVVAKTNASGAPTYQAQYAAFGNQTQTSGSTLDRQKSNSKDTDPTNLVDEGFRYRDLETGSFITKDPAGFVDGPNEYTYVVDNPWTHFDPEGLTAWDRVEGYAQGVTNGLIGLLNVPAEVMNALPRDEDAPGANIQAPTIPQVNNEHLATDPGDFEEGSRGGTVMFAGGSAVVGGIGGLEAAGAHATEELAQGGAKTVEEVTASSPKPVESPAPGGQSAASTKSDVDFSADLNKTSATSRSGHSAAGNKQLNEAMAKDPALRKQIETKYGDDAFDRTSTSNGGRRNPKGAEWDHNSTDSSKLDLKSKDDHSKKTRTEGQAGGGWKKFHKDKSTSSSDQ